MIFALALQTILIDLHGISYGWGGAAFGQATVAIGDLNGDGVPELAVGSPWGGDGVGTPGTVEVFSGIDGRFLWKRRGSQNGSHFGSSIANVGDADGDGTPDLMVGSPGEDSPINPMPFDNSGAVHILSGKDGSVIHSFYGFGNYTYSALFGSAIASADVDGDGVRDFIIGAPYQGTTGAGMYAGRAYVYSGQSHALLQVLSGSSFWDCLGSALCAVGDQDGDGGEDFLVGAYQYSSLKGPGYVQLISGRTFQVLKTIAGHRFGDQFGSSLANAGDLDGDGISEWMVGANQNEIYTNAPPIGPGYAEVFTGGQFTLRFRLLGQIIDEQFGYSVASAGDVNGDGVSDLIVGAIGESPGRQGQARVFSGRNGRKLLELGGNHAGDQFGYAVGGAGDVNGDGFADVFISAPSDDTHGTDSGRVAVFSCH